MTMHIVNLPAEGQTWRSDNKEAQALQITSSLPIKSKNLLQKIILTSSLLNRKLVLRGNNRETKLVNTILTSAWDLWNEMSTIIDIATLQVEGLHLYFQPLHVNSVIRGILDQILPRLQSRQQVLTLKLAPESPSVMADQLRLEQVLLTILSNVSQNTTIQGTIFMSTGERNEIVTIKVWGGPSSGLNGTASAPHNQTKQDGGKLTSGLSTELALCKYFIKLHKGNLWLPGETSAKGAFVLALPSIHD